MATKVPVKECCVHSQWGRDAEPKRPIKLAQEEPEGKHKEAPGFNPLSAGGSQPGQRAGPSGQQGVLLMKLLAQRGGNLHCGGLGLSHQGPPSLQ